MRHLLRAFLPGLLIIGMVAAASLVTASPAAAATMAKTTTCSNGVDDTPGLGLICEVTVVNTISATGGSARVTVRECHGAAGAPTAACTTKTTRLTTPVTAVTQCNNSTNGGGGTLRCSVRVTNNFVGLKARATAATVNECVGSGDGIANNCSPFPATTTGATITQCNGSANGGTLVRLQCTASGTKSAALGVRINQCNKSTNGGGALVICSATITSRVVSAATAASASGTPVTSLPSTSTTEVVTGSSGRDPLALAWVFALFALSLMWVSRQYRNRSDLR
ncbi:MAG: hypothetical protein ABI628_10860 [Chloroflexota bacterium]